MPEWCRIILHDLNELIADFDETNYPPGWVTTGTAFVTLAASADRGTASIGVLLFLILGAVLVASEAAQEGGGPIDRIYVKRMTAHMAAIEDKHRIH